MSWYRDNKDAWKEIIETVAAEERRWLKKIPSSLYSSWDCRKVNLPFVFKGGTSLSKVYALIDRFSEDIDLSMNRKPTESEKRKTKHVLIGIAEEMGFRLVNP